MTEKELKKLNRYQLLELLIMQTARADQLQQQLDEVQNQLYAREIEMENIGSIAEASVHISGVLEAAQNAADLYMEAVNKRIAKMEATASRRANRIIEEARKEAAQIIRDASRQGSTFEIQDLDHE